MTDETQKKHRFNSIDLVLLLAVIACIAGIIIRSNIRDTVLLSKEEKATATVLIEAILDESAEALHIGDRFQIASNNNEFGTLRSVEISPAKIRFYNNDGTEAVTHYYDRKDALCKIEISGYNTDSGFMINGTSYIGSGSSFVLHSKYIEFQCTVLDVETDTAQKPR